MAKSWKYYRAEAEQYRERNVFPGPLRTEMVDSKDANPDEFIHYHRDGKLGDGTDYFGVYAEDHRAWLEAQPRGLGLTEIKQSDIPGNKHTRLEQARLDEKLYTREVVDANLTRKGLPTDGLVEATSK